MPLVILSPVWASTTDLISRTAISSHIPVNAYSDHVLGASATGQFSVFGSLASNLVPNDTNEAYDIFVYDLMADTTERVSVANDGSQANGASGFGYDVSADGRYAVFASFATNLVAGVTDGTEQVYLRDRQNGTTTLVSADTTGGPGNCSSYYPRLSSDGQYVVFQSCAHDLIAGDSSGNTQIFRRDLQANTTQRVNVGYDGSKANAYAYWPSVSSDGRYVAFNSNATNLIPADTNTTNGDVFVRDMTLQSTTRASLSSAGAELTGHSSTVYLGQAISGDGRYVIFYTDAAAVPADTNNASDVYERDLVSNTTTLISAGIGGVNSNATSYSVAIATNGAVMFDSYANNLVAGDTNNSYDVFVYRPGAVPPIVRASLDAAGQQVNTYSDRGTLSGNGNLAFIGTKATLRPGDVNSQEQNYVLQVGTPGSVTEISKSPTSYSAAYANNDSYEVHLPGPSISLDGRFVAFTSTASNLAGSDTNSASDVFVRDRQAQSTIRASVTSVGGQSACGSDTATITPDGHYVAFTSCSALVPADNNNSYDAYRYDRTNGQVVLASIGNGAEIGNAYSYLPHISDDGNIMVFMSYASNLISGEVAQRFYIFARDIQGGTTQRISVGIAGAEANADSYDPLVSGNGNVVGFSSNATNLAAGTSGLNQYVYDRVAGTTEQVNVSSTGQQPNQHGGGIYGLSGDARYVVFTSFATNLTLDSPASPAYRVFVRDRQNQTTTLVSKRGDGTVLDNSAGQAHISADGRYVTFNSTADNYDPIAPDYGVLYQIFVYDTVNAMLYHVSTGASGQSANDNSYSPHLSADGKRIVFNSYAGNLSPLDGNGRIEDVFAVENYLDELFVSGFEN